MVQRSFNSRISMSRRGFLATAMAAGAPLLIGPSPAAHAAAAPAHGQIVTGHIGTGRRGRELLRHLKPYAAAVCDVDRNHLREGLEVATPGIESFTDYRALLERPDITAVVIATPNHWHGRMAIDACAAGKDVYVEPPAAFTLEECNTLAQTASRFGVVVAVGASSLLPKPPAGGTPEAAPYLLSAAANPAGGDLLATAEPPGTLNWEGWLGPAPWRPYNPDYCHDHWRWVLSFGGGRLMTNGVTALEGIMPALSAQPARIQVSATGNSLPTDLWDCPAQLRVHYTLEPGGIALIWEQAGPPAPPPAFVADPETGPAMSQWLTCLRSREAPAVPVATACRAAEWAILGNLAYRLRRTLVWDVKARSFIDDEQANRLIATPLMGAALS